MSLQALNWAMVQKCGSPAAKMVLIILSRFASAEGVAWPSRQTLADATEQSPDSVDRALKLLVERGFIEKGGRQARPDGGDSTVKYQLLFDQRRADADLAHNHTRPRVRQNERPGPPGEIGDTGADPVPQTAAGGVSQNAEGGAANLRLGGAANCGTSRKRKDSTNGIFPPSPRTGGALADPKFDSGDDRPESSPAILDPSDNGWARRGRRSARPLRQAVPTPRLAPDAAARCERLWRAFPENGRLGARQPDVIAAFAALSSADQELAIRTAAALAARCAENRSQARRIDRWLRDGLWRNGAVPDTVSVAPAPQSSKVFVREGSPEWEAWARYLRSQGRAMFTPTTIGGIEGWRFDSAMPPAEVA